MSRDTWRRRFERRFGKPIESYRAFQNATDGLGRVTFGNYLRCLPRYFLFLDEDPDRVIEQRAEDVSSRDVTVHERYERRTKAFLRGLVDEGKCQMGYDSRVYGFFRNNSKCLALGLGDLKLPKARRTRNYSPAREEVKLLFERAQSDRDRFIVACMFQNGFNPSDVAALRVGDYPVEPWTYFERARTKNGRTIRGVSMPEVCDCLRAYLRVRGSAGGGLLLSREGELDGDGVSQVLRLLIDGVPELAGVEGFVPTSLRDAFEDALTDAEGVKPKTKEGMMGHVCGIQHRYGGYRKMVERFTDAARAIYPGVCLSDKYVVLKKAEAASAELRDVQDRLSSMEQKVAMWEEAKTREAALKRMGSL